MRNLKHVSKFESLSAVLSAFFVVAVLFSCSKNMADVSPQQNAQLTSANTSSNASARTGSVAVPFENTFFVPCANGGTGEDVAITGKINYVYQLTETDRGFTMVFHDNVHEVTGVGLSSGETFVGSGGTDETVAGSWVNGQWTSTTFGQLKLISQSSVFTINFKETL
jgi:hypothetical protein